MIKEESLQAWSYESRLQKSLKNTLRKFDARELEQDATACIRHMNSLARDIQSELSTLNTLAGFRTKSVHSALLKFKRYPAKRSVTDVCNDLLSIRLIENYVAVLTSIESNESFRVVDMRSGKKHDDGYRGLHLYYKKSNRHYPIEIQVWSPEDAMLNTWLHMYAYKYTDAPIGLELKERFDKGELKTEKDFEKELEDVLRNS